MLEGEIVCGDERQLSGRVWVQSMDARTDSGISDGDVVVVGNRRAAQILAINCGAALMVLSNSVEPSEEVLERARERGTAIVVSPLDSYVVGPDDHAGGTCRALMECDPLSVPLDFLVDDMAEQIKELHYGAAVVVDADHRPVGLITRADLVALPRRQVILVDHAEQAQSVSGIDQAEIVEILDHHHIGSIETRIPVTATFDPVGSTATLVVERFRQRDGAQPDHRDHAARSGAVRHGDPELGHHHGARPWGGGVPGAGAGHRRARARARHVRVDLRRLRDLGRGHHPARRQAVSGGGGQEICIAQVEVVGDALLERKDELLEAMREERENKELALYALMVTDVLEKGTEMLVAGDVGAVARSLGVEPNDGTIGLPGVMSRKKEVAPKLMTAL